MKRRPFLRWLTAAIAGLPALPARADADQALAARLRRGGNIILMRHAATVPGIGDPDGFVLNQCATQRNLSATGRQDAARVGAAFLRLGIPVGAVLSSRWCRCMDTARLAFRRVDAAPLLDSMFLDDADTRARKVREARAWLGTMRVTANVVMVTHDVNIQALTGRHVRQGEMVVAAADETGALRVAGVWLP